MNPIEQIIANFGVVNFSAAAAVVMGVPNDVTAVDNALAPYINDPAVRASCASRIVSQRSVVPMVQQVAQPMVGQALLPVQVPPAPQLAWTGVGPQPVVIQQVAQPAPNNTLTIGRLFAWLGGIVVVGLVIATFVMTWVGLKTQSTTAEVANIAANVQTNLEGAITTDGNSTRTAVTTAETNVKGAITASETNVKAAITTEGQATRRSIWASRKANLDAVDAMALKLQAKHQITVKVVK